MAAALLKKEGVEMEIVGRIHISVHTIAVKWEMGKTGMGAHWGGGRKSAEKQEG